MNHVAIAVPDLEAASKMYRDVLGANVSEPVVRFKTFHGIFGSFGTIMYCTIVLCLSRIVVSVICAHLS